MPTKIKTVISLGGSIVVPEEINGAFLKQFHDLIIRHLDRRQFFIVVGGGYTARHYQASLKEISDLTRDDLDWLGIHATRLNAHLLRALFRRVAHRRVLNRPRLKESATEGVVIAGGWKPGWSTDYVAVRLAKAHGAKEIINLSNIDTLFDKDPKKHQDAKPILQITWKEFRKLVGNKWDPGLNLPFDPVASKLAEKLKMKVILMNGGGISNLENYLEGRLSKGTVIE